MDLFHGLAALALLLSVAAVAARVRFWLRAGKPEADGRPGAPPRPSTLGTLFWDGLVLRRVWRESRFRWLTHLAISWSFVGLFAIGSLGNMVADLGAPLEKDDAWFATLNDALGLALLAGIALAFGRRYVSPKPYTRTLFDDTAILLLLALLGAGGFFAEVGRYLEEGTPSSAGAYAFIGYPLSQAFEPLDWNWEAVKEWLWWSHSILALGLIVYIPYSKLFHMFTSPLTIAVNAGVGDAVSVTRGDADPEASASTL